MRNDKMLEMLNKGQIEELKVLLQDEIYTESLKKKPDAKKRYSAMKKYFSYRTTSMEALQKPCVVEFEGRKYISFTNSYSLALTTEDCGEIKLFEYPERYPNVTRLIKLEGIPKKLDFGKVIAEAKSKGYKLKKAEVDYGYKYLMHYDGAYFKIGLLDATFGIIDDGKEATVYHEENSNSPLYIENTIGAALVLPVRLKDDEVPYGVTVVDA